MKTEELMIGDILEYMGTIVKVYSIGAKICVKECFGKNTYIVDFDNSLKGLELTPEILEKNGFKKELSEDNNHYRFILIHNGIRFSLFYARSVFQWLGPLDFKYAHQLQHALKLCGINKEIEV